MTSACHDYRESLLAGAPAPGHEPACPECASFRGTLELVDRGLAAARDEALPAPPPFDRLEPAFLAAARSAVRKRKATWLAPFAAAVAAAAAIALLRPFGPPSLAPGARLAASGESRTVQLPGGTRLTMQNGEAQFLSAAPGAQRLLLERGTVALEVPRLPAGTSLTVETAEAAVVVHGTRFSVGRAAEVTEVKVLEGLVEVRPAGKGRPPFFLRPGESRAVEPLPVYRETLRKRALAELGSGDLNAAATDLESMLATEPPDATEGEGRALLGWLRQAAGDVDGAIAQYRQAVRRQPRGTQLLWAENAAADLALLLERKDPKSAVDAWQDYLVRFPAGAHAALARARLARAGRR